MATASSPALSMREIEPELRAISNPYLLGVHLEIPTEDLELFRANHPNNFIQQRTDVINYWLQNSKNISWDALARAVERMRGHRNLVSRLRKLATGEANQESESFSHASFNYCKSKKTKPKLSKKRARKRAIVTKGKLPIEEQLVDETLKVLKSDFSILLAAVRQSLERHKVSVESLLGHLRTIEAIGPNFEPIDVRHSKPLKTVVAHEFQSLGEVFVALAPYYSWFNHLIVRNIIETFCEEDEVLEKKWMVFQEKVRTYCERRVIDCPEDQYGEGDGESAVREFVVMKIDCNWATIRVDQLFHIRDSVAKVLNIKPFNLYLRAVEKRCIKMLFYVPNHAAMSNISHALQEALHTVGVVSVIYGPEIKAPIRKRHRLSGSFQFAVLPSFHLEPRDLVGDSVVNFSNGSQQSIYWHLLRSASTDDSGVDLKSNRQFVDSWLVLYPLSFGMLLVIHLPRPYKYYGVLTVSVIGAVLLYRYCSKLISRERARFGRQDIYFR